jgi:tetratricopeptide (TPR) repeat protein
MPLRTGFDEKLGDIKAFMELPPMRLMAIQHDEDLKQPLMRALFAMQEEEGFPHVLVYTDIPFESFQQYFEDLLEELTEANELLREEFQLLEVTLPPVPGGWKGEWTPEKAAARVARYQSAVAECLPDFMGSVVLILDPSEIADESRFAWSATALASATESDWAKYIALDRRIDPILVDLDAHPESATTVQFYLAPEEVEAQLKEDLVSGNLGPAETRQYSLLAGAFAASAGRSEEAEGHQVKALEMAEEDGSPEEQANILYNLGNNYLGQERFEEAEEAYLRSANLCLEQEINPLLALVLTNLGVALFRLQRVDQSLESFDVARSTFRGLGNPPGEAHALDNKARVLQAEGRLEEAEATWLEAMATYDGITAPHLQDVRESGRNDIRSKLNRFYSETGQKGKRAKLSSEVG